MMNSPAISVIIPMYNAEKYVAECLESIFIQTFQDYEVIVVDDCSTDNSFKIVEKYIPKFGGRLRLSSTEKNSGNGAFPRNKGLNFSRGEYIFNMDADDLITLTALEEFYTLAKNFNADVVYCEKNYEADAELKNIRLITWQKNNLVSEPEFEPDSLPERIKRIMNQMFGAPSWRKLVKREFLIEKEIFFSPVIRDDDIWTWSLVFHAKNFLRVPNSVYIYRNTEDSITRVERTNKQTINFWLNPVIFGVKILDDVMSKIKFFNENLMYRYLVLSFFVEISFSILSKGDFESFSIYKAVKEEFGDKLGEYDVLIPLLLNNLMEQKRILSRVQE